MSHILVHRVEDIALRRIARTAQIAALPPQQARRPQTLWSLNRTPWTHAMRGRRPIGRLGPYSDALALIAARGTRAGVPLELLRPALEQLADKPPEEWTAADLAEILPPSEEEVIPDLLAFLNLEPSAQTAIQYQALANPAPALEAGALVAGGTVGTTLQLLQTLAGGATLTDRRTVLIPGPSRLSAISAALAGSGVAIGIITVAIPAIGYVEQISLAASLGATRQLDFPLELNIDAPATLEVAYDITNTDPGPQQAVVAVNASVSYQPLRDG